MKKILFLHGFYASGQCVPAVALREAFADKATQFHNSDPGFHAHCPGGSHMVKHSAYLIRPTGY